MHFRSSYDLIFSEGSLQADIYFQYGMMFSPDWNSACRDLSMTRTVKIRCPYSRPTSIFMSDSCCSRDMPPIPNGLNVRTIRRKVC